jgi:hypothetical protein
LEEGEAKKVSVTWQYRDWILGCNRALLLRALKVMYQMLPSNVAAAYDVNELVVEYEQPQS